MRRRSSFLALGSLMLTLSPLTATAVAAPTPGSWAVGQDMREARNAPSRAVLGGDKVMLIGGYSGPDFTASNTAEIYNIDRNTWSSVTPTPRRQAGPGFATTLPDGKVLYVGGYAFTAGLGSDLDFSESRTALLFDPSGRTRARDGSTTTGSWTKTGSLPGAGMGANNQNAVVRHRGHRGHRWWDLLR